MSGQSAAPAVSTVTGTPSSRSGWATGSRPDISQRRRQITSNAAGTEAPLTTERGRRVQSAPISSQRGARPPRALEPESLLHETRKAHSHRWVLQGENNVINQWIHSHLEPPEWELSVLHAPRPSAQKPLKWRIQKKVVCHSPCLCFCLTPLFLFQHVRHNFRFWHSPFYFLLVQIFFVCHSPYLFSLSNF